MYAYTEISINRNTKPFRNSVTEVSALLTDAMQYSTGGFLQTFVFLCGYADLVWMLGNTEILLLLADCLQYRRHRDTEGTGFLPRWWEEDPEVQYLFPVEVMLPVWFHTQQSLGSSCHPAKHFCTGSRWSWMRSLSLECKQKQIFPLSYFLSTIILRIPIF